MNDLRVNSKTTIAEFKRKHNWLVDNATIKLNVSNIKSLTNDDIESLKCGDVVLKEDESGKHAYLVTFRNDTGICLTYVDASVVETQSYDKIDGVWTYNSEDKSKLPVNEENPSFKPIYCHPISVDRDTPDSNLIHISLLIFDNSNEEYNTLTKLLNKLDEIFAINPLAVFPITGALYYNVGQSLLIAQKIEKYETEPGIFNTSIRAVRPNGTLGYFLLQDFTGATVYDGVNKIN